MSEPLLLARGLMKRYRSGTRSIDVLRGADLQACEGETISIRGESGSGKSTLLHLLAGLDGADGGTILWQGVPNLDARRRGRLIGMVFQAFYLVPELTALENILLAGRIAAELGPALRSRAAELLRKVGLEARGHHLPAELSGGERQRVAVARALLNRPPLILADEPTGNLDENTGNEMIDLLLSLCAENGAALVLVTHNPAHAARARRPLVLHEGVLRPA